MKILPKHWVLFIVFLLWHFDANALIICPQSQTVVFYSESRVEKNDKIYEEYKDGDPTGNGVAESAGRSSYEDRVVVGLPNIYRMLVIYENNSNVIMHIGDLRNDVQNGKGFEHFSSGQVIKLGAWIDGGMNESDESMLPIRLEKNEYVNPQTKQISVPQKLDSDEGVVKRSPLVQVGRRNKDHSEFLPLKDAVVVTKVENASLFGNDATVTLENANSVTYIVRVTITPSASDTEVLGEVVVDIPAQAKFIVKVPPAIGKNFTNQLWVKTYVVYGNLSMPKVTAGYRIPFESGVKLDVSQSVDGVLTSHRATPEAIDMSVPLGTKILAAKGGTVVFVKNNSTVGGPKKKYIEKGNTVEILQADGSLAIYVHMKPFSIPFKVGDKVSQGDVIGKVGLTGWTTGPHLHFAVRYYDPSFHKVYINPEFYSPSGVRIPILYRRIVSSDGPIETNNKVKQIKVVRKGLIIPAKSFKRLPK